MTEDEDITHPVETPEGDGTPSTAAQRALSEAEARRRSAAATRTMPRELQGRGGKEPVRYGDWEVKGLASDF